VKVSLHTAQAFYNFFCIRQQSLFKWNALFGNLIYYYGCVCFFMLPQSRLSGAFGRKEAARSEGLELLRELKRPGPGASGELGRRVRELRGRGREKKR